MELRQLAETRFVMLQADWPTARARRLLEELAPALHDVIGDPATHAIVHRHDADTYHLYVAADALRRLEAAAPELPVREALRLDQAEATPLLDAHADALDAPDRCIVHEDGRVVGFLDAGTLVEQGTRRGSLTRVEQHEEEPVSRSLVAELPERIALHDTAWLLVLISAEREPDGIPVEPLPAGAPIDVLVRARRGFVLEGDGRGTLTVSTGEETLPLQFKLRAAGLGPGLVEVLAFHQGQALGKITLTPTVVASDDRPPPASSGLTGAHEAPLAPVSVRLPDLSMFIEENRRDGGAEYTIWLTATDPALGINLRRFGPLRLRMDAIAYFQDFFGEIESLPVSSPRDQAILERKLAARGANLFSTVFPTELQATLWRLRHRIKSIVVQSEEPWIPWELCKLSGEEEAGELVDGPFLCEAYAIARWIPGISFRPLPRLQRLAVVAPGDSALPFAPVERDYLLSLAGNGREVERVPATFLDVVDALAGSRHDGWHFTGHGAARDANPDRAAIYLEGDEPLMPEDLSGTVGNLRRWQPLVFLNACQVGRGGMSLTGVGGWARRFLDAGASAFVSTYWSVQDRPANEFAQAFYGRLLGGMPIGVAALEARAAIKPHRDATWLAYTVFADPLASLEA